METAAQKVIKPNDSPTGVDELPESSDEVANSVSPTGESGAMSEEAPVSEEEIKEEQPVVSEEVSEEVPEQVPEQVPEEAETESQMVPIEKPTKTKRDTAKYEYTIDSALYLKNKFTKTKKQMPLDKWDDKTNQMWRTKTLKSLISLLRLSHNKQTYKTHHKQLDKYRNTLNHILNGVNKVKGSKSRKSKKINGDINTI